MTQSKADAGDTRLDGHGSTSAPFDRVVARLKDVRPTSTGVRACCPAHDDSTPSLDVDRGDDGRVLLRCRSANCTPEAIVTALGITMRDLFPRGSKTFGQPSKSSTKSPKTHTTLDDACRAAAWSATDGGKKAGKSTVIRYDYTDTNGNILGGVFRFDFADGRPKELRRFRRDGDGWILQDLEAPRPLYHLHDLAKASVDEPVVFVEGEKCVEAVLALGLIATTSAGGAKQPLEKTDFSPLAGRHVVILPDNDDPGFDYATKVAAKALSAGAASVHRLDLPGLGEGEDIYDWATAREKAGLPVEQIAAELRELLLTATAVGQEETTAESDGEPVDLDEAGYIKLGTRDPASGKLVLSPKKTLPTAQAFLSEFHRVHGHPTLLDYAGALWAWRRNRFVEVEERSIENRLHPWLHEALRYQINKKTGELELGDFESNPGSVTGALKTIRAMSFLDASTKVPAWLRSVENPLPVNELLPCKTMTLHLPTQTVLQPTPALFNFNAIEFDYDPAAPEPVRWYAFLHQLFGDDLESLNLLQEWFGYSLIADTSQQKMLLIIGPRRSGKGTIARVLKELVGGGNVAGPTVGSLTGNFGLQPLLGKTLAMVSDARFSGDGIPVLVERLLCISGEDTITVDRKFLASVTMKLTVRFMFLTNELPRFTDASTALAGRFMVLQLTKSFFDSENVDLTNQLVQELPGILCWAIEGWRRLREHGRFRVPESSRTALQDIEDLSSPVGAFVRERCVVAVGNRTSCRDLFDAWGAWCTADGRTSHCTQQTFGRDLMAAVPSVRRRRSDGGYYSFYDGIGLKTQ